MWGAYALVRGGSNTSNLFEPTRTTPTQVCKVLKHPAFLLSPVKLLSEKVRSSRTTPNLCERNLYTLYSPILRHYECKCSASPTFSYPIQPSRTPSDTVVFIHPTLAYIMEWLAILSYRTLGRSGCGLSLGQTLTFVTYLAPVALG